MIVYNPKDQDNTHSIWKNTACSGTRTHQSCSCYLVFQGSMLPQVLFLYINISFIDNAWLSTECPGFQKLGYQWFRNKYKYKPPSVLSLHMSFKECRQMYEIYSLNIRYMFVKWENINREFIQVCAPLAMTLTCCYFKFNTLNCCDYIYSLSTVVNLWTDPQVLWFTVATLKSWDFIYRPSIVAILYKYPQLLWFYIQAFNYCDIIYIEPQLMWFYI